MIDLITDLNSASTDLENWRKHLEAWLMGRVGSREGEVLVALANLLLARRA